MKGRPTNDGRGRIGGRAKGTPNNTTTRADIADYAKSLLTAKRRRQFAKDLDTLEPKDRCQILGGIITGVCMATTESEI